MSLPRFTKAPIILHTVLLFADKKRSSVLRNWDVLHNNYGRTYIHTLWFSTSVRVVLGVFFIPDCVMLWTTSDDFRLMNDGRLFPSLHNVCSSIND